MTKTLGIIGSGMIGSTLAHLAVGSGLDVVVSNSRGPQTLSDLVGELGEHARAATAAEAAHAGDLVVATVPLSAYTRLPVAELAGKTVIDTMNYYPDRDGVLDEADVPTSVLVQRFLSESRVVKAFNNIDFHRLRVRARPSGAPDRSALPIAGDDEPSKAEVVALLDLLGYDAVDIGGLGESWRSQPGTPVYVQPYAGPAALNPGKIRPGGLSEEEKRRWFFGNPGVPVAAQAVRDLIEACPPR